MTFILVQRAKQLLPHSQWLHLKVVLKHENCPGSVYIMHRMGCIITYRLIHLVLQESDPSIKSLLKCGFPGGNGIFILSHSKVKVTHPRWFERFNHQLKCSRAKTCASQCAVLFRKF